MVSVPVSRCSVAAQSCSVCVALQDPYCAWSNVESKCVDLYDFDEDDINTNAFLQNVVGGVHDGCAKASTKSSENDVRFAGSRGVQLLMLKTDFVVSSYPATSTRLDQVILLSEANGLMPTYSFFSPPLPWYQFGLVCLFRRRRPPASLPSQFFSPSAAHFSKQLRRTMSESI